MQPRWRPPSRLWGPGLIVLLAISSGLPVQSEAKAAEYQGQTLDGPLFDATAYSYETGGTYEIQVRFRKRRATMIFAGGGRQTIRLNSLVITDPQRIEGFQRGFVTIGGIFSIGVADNSSGNLQPPRPRPLEGFWRISLKTKQKNGADFSSP